MHVKSPLAPSSLAMLIYITGCSGTGADLLAGRNALQTGRPNDAIGYLQRAAQQDPRSRTPYRVSEGVLTFLGRAYYETHRDDEARKTLEAAVSLNQDDPLAHLYLGLTLIRSGERERGRREVENGLTTIDQTLESIAMDRVYGFYWDPAMAIRKATKSTLSAKLDDTELARAAERIAIDFDAEIDRARRDEASNRSGGGGGGN